MAQIVTVKNGQTNGIEYPRTVKSALLNDDGTFLNPLTQTNIINDLTTGGETSVLSAQQGVELNSAIGQIATDRGYLNPKRITLAEMETTFLSGKYFIAGARGYLDVTSHDTSPSDYCLQTHYSLAGDLVRCRTRNVGVWTPWKEIATTESYVLQPSDLRNGWIAGENLIISRSGKIVTISGYMTNGTTKSGTILLNIPEVFRPPTIKNIILPTYAFPSAPVNNYFELRTNGDLVIGAVASNPSINITFSYTREA